MPSFIRSRATSSRPSYPEPSVQRLCRQLRSHLTFTRGYSPLNTAILESFLIWLSDPRASDERLESDHQVLRVCEHLVAYADSFQQNRVVEASLRFAAALHHRVLKNDPAVSNLRNYYASVGGLRSPTETGFEKVLLGALDELGDEIFSQARDWRVQINESSRGLTWLLPASILGIEAAHLLELGTCAGLNLYGEQRGYRLMSAEDQPLNILGRGGDGDFLVKVQDDGGVDLKAATWCPEILSRTGGDLEVVNLGEEGSQERLAACIWADQPDRLLRLRRGFELHQAALRGEISPVTELVPLQLPDDLKSFLRRHAPQRAEAPVISFNNYVTEYLNDVDQRAVLRIMRDFARQWSLQHQLPWMWVRFEPPRRGEPKAPQRGWCRWTVELFDRAQHEVLPIGWGHPHMRAVRFLPALSRLVELGGED